MLAKRAFVGAGAGQFGSVCTCPPTDAGKELERLVLHGSRYSGLSSQTHKWLFSAMAFSTLAALSMKAQSAAALLTPAALEFPLS